MRGMRGMVANSETTLGPDRVVATRWLFAFMHPTERIAVSALRAISGIYVGEVRGKFANLGVRASPRDLG
jgi:hypothetical protein